VLLKVSRTEEVTMSNGLGRFPKDLRPYIKEALSMGYDLVEGKKHPKLVRKNEQGHKVDIITLSTSPSKGNRSHENAVALFRQRGIDPRKR